VDRARLSADGVHNAIAELDPDWSGSTDAITRTVKFGSFLDAVDFISRMAPIAEQMDHHPDLSLSWRTVVLTLTTHSSGGVTVLDATLANRLDPLIAELLERSRPVS
jgi:4a-hydroxytetrahydrobiopterin dehydratase